VIFIVDPFYIKKADLVLSKRSALCSAISVFSDFLLRSDPSDILYPEISKRKLMTENFVRLIDNALDHVSPYLRELLTQFYVSGMSIGRICELHRWDSTNSYYYQRNKALTEFALCLFGAEACSQSKGGGNGTGRK